MFRISDLGFRISSFAWRLGAMAVWALVLTSLAGADQVLRMGLEDLTRQADAIVIARVKSKDAVFADRLIQTRYALAADQYLKGGLGATIELTQVGGTVQQPLPLTQRVEGSVELFLGEKALLFLDLKNTSGAMASYRHSLQERATAMRGNSPGGTGAALPQPLAHSPLTSTPLILGAWQGRFTIFKGEDGAERAVQLRSELGGLATDEKTLALLRATANRADAAQTAVAQRAAPKTGAEPAADEGEEAVADFAPPEALRQGAEGLEELKAEIRTYVQRQQVDGLRKAPAPPAQAPSAPGAEEKSQP